MMSFDIGLWLTRKLIKRRRDAVKKSWSRVLPYGEYVGDRWEKARYMGFGEGTSVYDSCVVLGDVRVGSNTWIGPNTVLDGSGGLIIGDYCSISAGVQIYSHDTVNWAVSGGEKSVEYSPTVIESRVYLGPNVIVQRGVRIGFGTVIGANSLVTRDIPPNSRAWGSPCQIIADEPQSHDVENPS